MGGGGEGALDALTGTAESARSIRKEDDGRDGRGEGALGAHKQGDNGEHDDYRRVVEDAESATNESNVYTNSAQCMSAGRTTRWNTDVPTSPRMSPRFLSMGHDYGQTRRDHATTPANSPH